MGRRTFLINSDSCNKVNRSINFFIYIKQREAEEYIFFFDDSEEEYRKVIAMVAKLVESDTFSFNWDDEEFVRKSIREMKEKKSKKNC